MLLTELCILSSLLAAPAEPVAFTAPGAARFAQQNPRTDGVSRGGARSPAGGTPEPATMMLVAGAVLGYGALRRRASKAAATERGGA